MLRIDGGRSRFCDGFSRRNFLKIGALGFAGLSLPQILKAEAAAGVAHPHKAVIMIFLPGGPAHQDIFDLKPQAPSDIRGEFQPIKTNVAGIEICELLPMLAKRADRYSIIRSMVGCTGDHDAFQCQTGRSHRNMPPGGWPSLGSCVAKLQGQFDPAVPAFVGLAPKMGEMRWADPGQPGYLGPAYAPFKPSGDGMDDMVLNGVTLDRLSDRRALLGSLDHFRRDVDGSGMMEGMDAFNQQAMGLLTSSKLAKALDLNNEDPRVVERYGKGDPRNRDDGGPRLTSNFLVARRLVEAGARCVTLAFSRWDHHGRNFPQLREDLPLLDQGLSALLDDLRDRGLENDVSVIVWGEFGRSPIINKNAGRDHWPRVSCALMAGGGMKHGQVIGATDRLGGEAVARPVQFGEVFATLYDNLGIDVNKITFPDLSGRPQYLVDGCQPMKEFA
ncbi:MAG TPA: DUF1501 domain-containing protein [Tepidisphaeraceae bacterium]|jgi:hypothetical protein|nr:DUF1501 domain-containing protein [Tepidisphaeraceae bacterium]